MPDQIIRETRCVEMRAAADSRTVTGRAIVFNSPAHILDFDEVILPDAVTEEVLNRSDVVLLLEHDLSRGVLGRWRQGKGTLQLDRRDDGVYVSCELPDTPLGNEVLEGVRRGDYSQMSFCFSVQSQTWTVRDGEPDLRTIDEIEAIYDVSVVAHPAYEDTKIHVNQRGRQKARATTTDNQPNIFNNMSETTNTPGAAPEEQRAQAPQPTPAPAAAEATEQRAQAPQPAPTPAQPAAMQQQEARNVFTPRSRQQGSAEAPSLMRIIRSQMRNSNVQLSAADSEMLTRGNEMMRSANLEYGGGIVIPVEARASGDTQTPTTTTPLTLTAGTASHGSEAIATDTLNILGPLYNKLVLAQAGATVLSGLVGNISLPFYSGSSAAWADENAEASNGAGTTSNITFSPKRLTTFIDISNLFLIQDSVNAEALLRADLVEAIRQKLEATILGNGAGSATQPKGLFNGVAKQVTPTYKELIGLEQTVEEANVTGSLHYIMSPAIKAALRSTSKDTGSGRFLMEGSDVNGIPALVTNNCKGIILGDFADYVICQWGGIELVVDSTTQATKGMTRIVINSYWDAQPRRNNFAKATLKPAT